MICFAYLNLYMYTVKHVIILHNKLAFVCLKPSPSSVFNRILRQKTFDVYLTGSFSPVLPVQRRPVDFNNYEEKPLRLAALAISTSHVVERLQNLRGTNGRNFPTICKLRPCLTHVFRHNLPLEIKRAIILSITMKVPVK